MLSKEGYARAREFMMSAARPVERAIFLRRFEAGGVNDVLAALGKFQNPDGGFGHGLEPDSRTSESSVLCTDVAFELLALAELQLDRSEMVEKAIAFYISKYDENLRSWRIIPPETEDAPHANHWDAEGLDARFDFYRINPRLEVLARLYDYSDLVPGELLKSVTKDVFEHLPESSAGMGVNDIIGAVRLSEARGLPFKYLDALQARLADWIPDVVETDRAKWAEYCLRPLEIIKDPSSPWLPLVREAVLLQLEMTEGDQSVQGCWEPFWSWHGAFPEDWEIAKVEWQGYITLNTLFTLANFGMIEM